MRRTGITAAEAVGLSGLSQQMDASLVYERKLRPVGGVRQIGDARSVLKTYCHIQECKIERRPMSRNPIQGFAICESGWQAVHEDGNPTRLVIPVRLKCWPWSNLTPHLEAMACWDLGVTGLQEAHVAILFGQNRWSLALRVFPVQFNIALWSRLYGLAEHLMTEYVLQGIPPMVDTGNESKNGQ